MAKRRSLNRRWSRRSANGSAVLNDDTNIIDEVDDPVWWRHLENRPNSVRPSGRFSLGEASTATELNPNSTLNDTELTGEWWEALQKTSQDFFPKNTNQNNSKSTVKRDITSTTDSDTEDKLPEPKKRRVNLRKNRRTFGKNAFSQALDSSGPDIESEPIPSQNTNLSHTSFKSLDELPSRRTRQQSKNESMISHNSSSASDEIRKTRPTIFKKPRPRSSLTPFDDIIEGDDSVIGPSQDVDAEKSKNESDISDTRYSTRRNTKVLKQIDNDTLLSKNKSLNQSKESVNKSINQSTRNESLNQTKRSRTSRKVLSSPTEISKKNQIPESDDESEPTISQPREGLRRSLRKRNSENSFNSIINDSDMDNRELSSQEIKPSNFTSQITNNSSRSEKSNGINLCFSPIHSEGTSISEELKIGNPSQRSMIADGETFVGRYETLPSIVNEILEDFNSDDIINPDSIISEEDELIETNNENKSPEKGSKSLPSQTVHDVKDKSKNSSSLKNYSTNSLKENDANLSVKRKKKSNVRTSQDNTKEKLNESSSKNKLQSPGKHNKSKNIPISESETSDEDIIIKLPTRKGSRSTKIPDEESHTEEDPIFNAQSSTNQSLSREQERNELEENNNGESFPSQKSPVTRKNKKSSGTTSKIFEKSVSSSKPEEKSDESDYESDAGTEISRDPSAYELPDMNRSDSVSLSESDDEGASKNPSSEKKSSPMKRRSSRKRGANISTEVSKITEDISTTQVKIVPSTSGVQRKSTPKKSTTPGRQSAKINVSKNQRSILNFLTPRTSGPIHCEPLPTEEEVKDFKEKLKAVTAVLDENKESRKDRMNRELEEMRMKLANEKNSSKKKVSKITPLLKKPVNPPKPVDKAFIVNGKVYKQPKLPRPKRWVTDRLYKYLWNKLEPKFKLETRVRSEKFVINLSDVFTLVMKRKKYENYKGEVDTLMKNMARLGIIKTRNDFYNFCYDFLPYEFREKVTPILLPGNKTTIPFDPDTVDVPILNE